MEAWAAPRSLLAPLFVGVNQSIEGFPNPVYAFDAAMGCIPDVDLLLREPVGKSWVRSEVPTKLTAFMLKGKAAEPYATRIRLIMRREGSDVQEALKLWRWEAAILVLKPGLAAPAIPKDCTAAMFAVTSYTIREGAIRSAGQLALLRHLWVESLKSVDPSLIIVGGRSDWDDAWLTEAATP